MNPTDKHKKLRDWAGRRKEIVEPDGKKYIDVFCELYDYAIQLELAHARLKSFAKKWPRLYKAHCNTLDKEYDTIETITRPQT